MMNTVFLWIGQLVTVLVLANLALGLVEFVAFLLDQNTYAGMDDDVLLAQHLSASAIALFLFLIGTCIVIAQNAPSNVPVAPVETIGGGTWV